ncbi:MAG TPA: ABC transporter ATP-binding protein [Burkholderiales bacterium]|jgi:branched-chain amino acid transport system ATP-binding protein|nr:ABC transporter ATP-binding protein [Burkholderiales bacterium]
MLEARNLRVSYGGAPAVDGVSLDVPAGGLAVVVGPNGAGKTTLINAIAGVHRIDAGELRLDGRSLAGVAPYLFCAHGVALVPEGRRLFTTLTVRENLELGAYRRPGRARVLEEVLSFFPALEAKLGAPAGTLSGGQQQMVALGRALMAQPKLLLLDEPSLGLAPLVVAEMFRLVRAIHARGVAVLLVEQNAAAALDLATRAYVLEEGRIVAEGPPGELAGEPRIRRAYLGLN